MTAARTTAPPASDETAFRAFAVLWAIASLFETALIFGSSGGLRIVLAVLLARCTAGWILLRPSAPGRLLLLNVAVMIGICLRLPKMNNHGIFIFLVCATVLLAWLRLALGSRSARVGGGRLYATFAPYLRWSLLAMYFWAVIHKLNVDFFSPDVSCGPAQLFNVRERLPFLPVGPAMQYFSIYGTLIVEAGIPLLLVFRRTRVVGVIVAAGFHYVLGAGYTGFSAMLFAMLSLFAPPSFWDGLAAQWRPWAARAGRVAILLRRALPVIDRGWGAVVVGLAVALVGTQVFAPRAQVVATGPPLLDKSIVLGAWLVYGAALMVVCAVVAWRARALAGAGGILRPPYASLALMPLLVFANGLGPHVGLKNTQVYAMFSNLHTGGGRTNHLFIPASWQLWDYQRDLVTLRETNDPVLAKLIGPSWRPVHYFSTVVLGASRMPLLHDAPTWRLPYVALQRRVGDLARAGQENLSITYERDGITRHVPNAERDPELTSLPPLLNKLMLMRAVQDTDRGFCMW